MFNKFIFNIVVFSVIIQIARASILSSPWTEIYITVLIIFLYFEKVRNIDERVFLLIIVWLLLNFMVLVFFGIPFNITRILRTTIILIILPYLIVVAFGDLFWQKFEQIIYNLTLISLPIFALNVIFPDLFINLQGLFLSLTNEAYYKYVYDTTYWSAIIYTNSIYDNDLFIYRNAGFMWEPGAFAMILIFGLIYTILKSGFKYNKRILVYTVAIITTFSTAGYIALFFIILAKYVRKISIMNIVVIIILTLVFFQYIYQLDFIGGKIDNYLYSYNSEEVYYSDYYRSVKVNRFQIAFFDVMSIIRYPLGYGYGFGENEAGYSDSIIGVNGLTAMAKMWGVPIFIYILILLKRYFNVSNNSGLKNIELIFLFISVLIMFFSNPIDRSVFPYLMILSAFFAPKSKLSIGESK